MHVFKVAFDLRGNQKNNKQTKTNNKPNKQTKVLHSGKTERCAWELSWFSSNAAQRWHTSIPGSTFSPTSALSRDRNQKLLIWKETSRIPEWWEWSVGPTLHTRRVVDQTHLGRSFLSHRREKGRKEGRKVRPVLWDDVCRCYYSWMKKRGLDTSLTEYIRIFDRVSRDSFQAWTWDVLVNYETLNWKMFRNVEPKHDFN